MTKPCEPGYTVGFGKPPQSTQFKKGQSGNPAGRPKGKTNVATVIEQALSEPVVVNEGGKRRTRTKLEVAITQVVNKAAGGDLKAMKLLMAMVPMLGSDQPEAAMSPDLVADRQMATQLAARLAARLATVGASAMLAGKNEPDHE